MRFRSEIAVTILRAVNMELAGMVAADYTDFADLAEDGKQFGSQKELDEYLVGLESDMREAARKFEFEKAAKLRDMIRELKTREFLFA